jgi:hypothetical protein
MSSLRWALHRFRQISPRERRLLAMASGLLPVVHGLQQGLPFRVWRRLLERDPPPSGPARGAPSVREIAWSVEAARNWLPGTYKCLPSAYAVHLLLFQHGYASEIHVGVSRDLKGAVEAHAWVNCQGETVIGAVEDLARFIPLPPLSTVKK